MLTLVVKTSILIFPWIVAWSCFCLVLFKGLAFRANVIYYLGIWLYMPERASQSEGKCKSVFNMSDVRSMLLTWLTWTVSNVPVMINKCSDDRGTCRRRNEFSVRCCSTRQMSHKSVSYDLIHNKCSHSVFPADAISHFVVMYFVSKIRCLVKLCLKLGYSFRLLCLSCYVVVWLEVWLWQVALLLCPWAFMSEWLVDFGEVSGAVWQPRSRAAVATCGFRWTKSINELFLNKTLKSIALDSFWLCNLMQCGVNFILITIHNWLYTKIQT